MGPIKLGVIGLGTVGSGTYNVLQRNSAEISRRAGREIKVTHICVKDPKKPRDCTLDGVKLSTDPIALVQDPDIDIVLELMGGIDVAKQVTLKAIANGKPVVTANKALIAHHGSEIFQFAHKHNITVAFEAAVAGGIPIIKSIREGLGANRVDEIYGIINGTSNYILTNMYKNGINFDIALTTAQQKGYAESDPTGDIAGFDAQHKLAILTSIAFGVPLNLENIYVEGIQSLQAMDINYASQLGYVIKQLSIARRTKDGIEARTHPVLLSTTELLTKVDGVMNAVLINANAVGPTLYYGAGAGAEATASAVIADVVDVVRTMSVPLEHRVPYLAFKQDTLAELPIVPIEQISCSYYLRCMAQDEPGILASISQILAKYGISIQTIIQKPIEKSLQVPIIILTHPTKEAKINLAKQAIENVKGIEGSLVKLRIEQTGEISG